MKKVPLIVLSTLLFSTAAMADFNAKPYVGLDYVMLKTDAEDNDLLKNNISTLGFTVGAQFDENYGAEAFYLTNVSSMSKESDIKANFNSFGALATYTYNMENNVYLKAALGLAMTLTKVDYEDEDTKYHSKDNSTSLAGKVGIGYNVSKNVATELTYNRLEGTNGVGFQIKYKF